MERGLSADEDARVAISDDECDAPLPPPLMAMLEWGRAITRGVVRGASMWYAALEWWWAELRSGVDEGVGGRSPVA